MITIDGLFGEGGGQIVRSSIALSIVTGKEIAIENVRAGRSKPGLKRQHVTAVKAAAEICGAEVEGAELGSNYLHFKPGAISPGEYTFRIGTAGSTTLVLQTVLVPLLLGETPSTVALEGGTHNQFAPPFDYLQKVYLPLIDRMGMETNLVLEKPGFYPAGGGRFTAKIQPVTKLRHLDLLERGKLLRRSVRALVANLPDHIAERECKTIARKSGWPAKCFSVERCDESNGPGNVVLIEVEYENVTELFAGFGEKRVSAEKVATRVWKEAQRYIETDVPVGEHLADQLILPLAISAYHGGPGGSFLTGELSDHTTTHIEVVRKLLQIEINVTKPNSGANLGSHLVTI